MTALTEFLFPAPAERRPRAIVKWWEGRRLHFNLFVGGAGVISLGVLHFLIWLPPSARAPGPPLIGVVVFGVLANVCYSLGPLLEIVMHKLWGRHILPIGPTLYRMGLTFSLGLTLLPVIIGVIDWGVRILKAVLT